MTEEVKDVEVAEVDTAEAFRVAAENARKTFEAISKEGVASSPEPGSSPEVGAESVVSETPKAEVEEAGKQDETPEVKAEEIVIDPEKAWGEYKDDEARKKALAHNKAYGIEMAKKAAEAAKKAEELEAQLNAISNPEKTKEPETETEVEVQEIPYEEWVSNALQKPETDGQKSVAKLASEYDKLVAEKVEPVKQSVAEREKALRDAESVLREREVTLKFLQGRKDPSLYEDDIRDAKEAFAEARVDFSDAKNAFLEAQFKLDIIERDRLAHLGVLRKEALTAHQSEIATRRDSISAKKLAEEEQAKQSEAEKALAERQAEVDGAWENAKLQVIKSHKLEDPAMQEVLRNAADGAIIKAAHEGKSISVEEFVKFIEESSLKPFQGSVDKVREKAVRSAISIASEPTPAKATSDKPNADVQPMNYEEWRQKARAVLKASM